jgi:hypothetical protein
MTRVALLCACIGTLSALAQDAQPVYLAPRQVSPLTDDLRIGWAPNAEEARDRLRRAEDLDLVRRAASGDAAARDACDKLPSVRRVEALCWASEAGQAELRGFALKALAAEIQTEASADAATSVEPQKTALHGLARAAAKEADSELAQQAHESWRAAAQPGQPLRGPALDAMGGRMEAPDVTERFRAFNHLAGLGGDREVVEEVATRITRRWGAFPRAHLVVATQRSYIADYDISGAVFDPVIRSFTTGVVFETKIYELVVHEWVRHHLRALGATPLVVDNPKMWREFLRK